MLLIIEALLLILAALGQDHRSAAVEGQIFPLDMALDSFDDQYKGCREKMAHLVKTKYLTKEINKSAKYKMSWQSGEMFVKFPNDQLTRDHLIAMHVYIEGYVHQRFNSDTRHGKTQYKHKTFKWYSLHFLLAEAIQILRKTQNKCYFTYRGTTANFDKNVLNKEVRFGSFASSSLDRNVARSFGTVSCFEIKTCESADLTTYSIASKEREVLIPPYEKFKVTAVKTKAEQKDLWCETVFKLESSGTESYLNCAVAFKKRSKY